jgi:mRNA interferase RelE/StbE
MQVDFTKHFSRQLDDLRDESLRDKLREIVKKVMNATTVRDIPSLKKLKGHPSAYRIRVGDYRVGLFIEHGSALFAALEHRKEIYNKFP